MDPGSSPGMTEGKGAAVISVLNLVDPGSSPGMTEGKGAAVISALNLVDPGSSPGMTKGKREPVTRHLKNSSHRTRKTWQP